MLHSEAELWQADILLDFNVLIFQGTPETFHFCIIQTSSPSVHADQNAVRTELRYKRQAGEFAFLIRIENLRVPIGVHRSEAVRKETPAGFCDKSLNEEPEVLLTDNSHFIRYSD